MPPSRTWRPRRDAEAALRRVDTQIAGAATKAALFERACVLDRLGRTGPARDAYLAVLACDAGHAGALANLGALLFAGGYTSAARTVYARAAACHPGDPDAHVNLANLLRLSGQTDDARVSYEAALRLDAAHPEAHQGLSHLLDGVDELEAARHRALGFANRARSTAIYRGEGRPVKVLQLVSARGGNIPTSRILDDRTCLTHTLVTEFADPAINLPPHDLVFNAIGDADRCVDALAAAVRLLARTAAPVLNPPHRILLTRRADIARDLAMLPGTIVPRIAVLPRAAFALGPPAGFVPPFLLRSPGFHTGQHFRKVDQAADLPAAAAALPGETLMAITYLDATGVDGASRKYRAMFIGGDILPLHLAISADWKVHYFTAGMAAHAAHRAEEMRFLADMPAVLGPTAMTALSAIRDHLGLDYGGIDFAIAPDGRLMVFEANATMTLVPPPPDAMWNYRRPAIDCALSAARALVRHTARAGSNVEGRQRRGGGTAGVGLQSLLHVRRERLRQIGGRGRCCSAGGASGAS